MAKKKKSLGSVKRFGARYGRRVKHKLAAIEAVQKGKHTCPYCRAEKVKQVAVGIWHCKRCNSKFTGRAYTLKTTHGFDKKGAEETPIEVEELTEEPDENEEDSEDGPGEKYQDKTEEEPDKYVQEEPDENEKDSEEFTEKPQIAKEEA